MEGPPPPIEPVAGIMPRCCAQCDADFDARTQQQLQILQRFSALGMAMAEAAVDSRLFTRHIDYDVVQNFEFLGRGVRRCLALEAKLTEDARRRHQREAHGAPPPRERAEAGDQDEPVERPAKKLPLVTTEDVESVIGPESGGCEAPEGLLADTREKLLDPMVDEHSPAAVAASICKDLNIEEDVSVFLEPVPTRDDFWVQAEVKAARARDVPVDRPDASDRSLDGAPPVAKGRDPP